ncbi:MAG: alpha/beta hydrolase [bacterium]
MPFTFPLDPAALFAERSRQFRGWGIPAGTIERVRSRIDDAWRDGPGGWTTEWSRAAEAAERRGKLLLAAACHGAAKFPSLVTPSRRDAYRRQLQCYLAAAPAFPCAFERRSIEIRARGASLAVATHVFAPRASAGADTPLVVLSGGVDTWKVELHRIALLLVRMGGFRVAAIDMPGTGESTIPLAPDADAVYAGVVAALRGPRTRTAAFGISAGGPWAAKLALMGAVDAGVDLGGPVGATARDGASLLRMPNGMPGIVANACGLDALPPPEKAERLLDTFSLRTQGLLTPRPTNPLLAINGTDDAYVPAADLAVFRAFPNATVWAIAGATHCAAERIVSVLLAATAWLRVQLHGAHPLDRLLLTTITRLVLHPR